MNYNKPPKTYKEQLAILAARGLVIQDRDFATHCLERYNYYRISAYRFAFLKQDNSDNFLSGTTGKTAISPQYIRGSIVKI